MFVYMPPSTKGLDIFTMGTISYFTGTISRLEDCFVGIPNSRYNLINIYSFFSMGDSAWLSTFTVVSESLNN